MVKHLKSSTKAAAEPRTDARAADNHEDMALCTKSFHFARPYTVEPEPGLTFNIPKRLKVDQQNQTDLSDTFAPKLL